MLRYTGRDACVIPTSISLLGTAPDLLAIEACPHLGDFFVQADVNVSLTSISLLWTASDLLGKLYTKARSSSRASLDAEPQLANGTTSPGAQLDSEQYQELVRLLYGALQVCSVNGLATLRKKTLQPL